MATNFDNSGETNIRSGVSLLQAAVGLTPMAAGAWYGIKKIKSNEAISNPLRQNSVNRTLGKAIGAKATKVQQARNKAASKAVERVKEMLNQTVGQSAELDQISQSIERYNALLQTMSVTLESTSGALDATAVQSLKSEIARAMDSHSPEDVKRLAKSAINTMLQTNNDELMMQWQQNLDEFNNVADQLEVPNFGQVRSGQSFNPVDVGTLSGQAKSRWNRLQGALGGDYKARLFRGSASASDGTDDMLVAQIYSKGGRYKSSIPLQLGDGHMFRTGESFNTLYSMPGRTVNMSDAQRHLADVGPGMNYGTLAKAGAIRGMPDYFIGNLNRAIRSGDFDFGRYNEEMRDHMTVMDRAAMRDDQLGWHIRQQAALKSNALFAHGYGGMTDADALGITAKVAMAPGMEAGAVGGKRLLTGHGSRRRGVIGLSAGSAFEALQHTYGASAINRTTLPITAREAQFIGRPTMSADPFRLIGNSGLVGVGSIAQSPFYNSMGWAEIPSGGSNRMMIIDFKTDGMLYRETEGQGLGFSGTKARQIKSKVISILDPRAAAEGGHTYMTSRQLNQLMQSPDKSLTLGAQELRKGVYFGQAGNAAKYAGADPTVLETTFRYINQGKSAGKSMLYLSEQQTREISLAKGFGLSFKGNIDARSTESIDLMYGQDRRLVQLEKDMEAANIRGMRHEAVHTSSDMFKKGSAIFTHQIASSARQHGVSTDVLRTAAEGLANPLFDSAHGRYAEAAFRIAARRGVGGGALGTMLAGVYYGAGSKGTHGLDQGKLEDMIRGTLSGQEQTSAINAMRRGIVSFVDTMQFGEHQGDWGAARAGAESRLAKTAFERLRSMGMSKDAASNIVSNLYTKKVGIGKHFTFASEMLAMGRSLVGQRNFLDAVSERDVTRLRYGDMAEALDGGTLSEYLRKQKSGAILDFSGAPAHVERAVQETFGQNTIYLSGKKAMEAAPGTMIRQAGGQTKDVSGVFGRFVDSLWGRLEKYQSPAVADKLRSSLKLWQDQGIDLTSSTITDLTRGKISGSSSPRVNAINMNTMLGFNPQQKSAITSIFTGSRASAVMADTNMFLNEMSAQGGAIKPRSEQARMFFTGMEQASLGNVQALHGSGLARIAGRHPIMASGNVFATQMYRHAGEVASLGGQDDFFGRILDEGFEIGGKEYKGQELMQKVFRDDTQTITSFQQIAKMKSADQKRFFNHLINNIRRFTTGEGGGTVTVLRAQVEIGKDGEGAPIMRDIGLAPQAFMDADGDTMITLAPNQADSRSIKKLMAEMTPAQLGSELRSRVVMDEFAGMIKGGIVQYGRDAFGMTTDAIEAQMEDIKKEVGIDMQTGTMDTRLRPLHEAFMEHGGGGAKQRVNRAFLGALEEHVLLKAKHMERFAPVADTVGQAAWNLVESPSEATRDAFKSVLDEQVLRGQDSQFKLGRFNVKNDLNGLGNFLNRATAEGELSWSSDQWVEDAYQAAKKYKEGGGVMEFTKGQLSARMKQDPHGALLDVIAGKSMEAAALAENAPGIQPARTASVIEQMKNAMGKIDRRMTVPLALGAGISMLAMGMVGSPGYASQPIVAPGEQTSPYVENAIAKGNLFGGRDPGVDAPMQAGGGHASMDVPINQPTTYMNRPSSYSIRGQVQSYAGLAEATQYINRFAGSAFGSIAVNDSRRPITQNYVDRLMGEY